MYFNERPDETDRFNIGPGVGSREEQLRERQEQKERDIQNYKDRHNMESSYHQEVVKDMLGR